MPPIEHVLDKLIYVMLPAVVAASVVAGALVFLCGKRSAGVAAVFALLVGCAAGNYCPGVVGHFQSSANPGKTAEVPEEAEPKSALEEFGDWLLQMQPKPPLLWKPERTGHHWLPAAGLLAILVGFATRWPRVPAAAALLLRALVAFHAAWLLVPAPWRVTPLWSMPAFSAVVLLEWTLFDYLARRGSGGTLLVAAAVMMFGAAAVTVNAHTAIMADVGLFTGAALLGIAAVAWWKQADVSAVLPAVAVMLPGLMLNVWYQTLPLEGELNHQIPWQCFLLTALTPLALAPALLPFWQRRTGWLAQLAIIVLAIAAVAIAMAWAMEVEPMSPRDFGVEPDADEWSSTSSERIGTG